MQKRENRSYKRGTHFHPEAKISRDGQNWQSAEVYDLSYGGLKFHADGVFELGDLLWFDLAVHGFLSEFKIDAQGTILRQDDEKGRPVYGVAFNDLGPDAQMYMDENDSEQY